jgi:hypothetical protein
VTGPDGLAGHQWVSSEHGDKHCETSPCGELGKIRNKDIYASRKHGNENMKEEELS